MEDDDIRGIADDLSDDVRELLKLAHLGTGRVFFEPPTVLSEARMLEVVRYAMRDLQRLEHDQENRVAITKYLAYIGFWFCKLKPINSVYALSGNGGEESETVEERREIEDVNERIALMLMDRVFWRVVYAEPSLYPTEWNDCKIAQCVRQYDGNPLRGECYRVKKKAFLKYKGRRYLNYIIYGMRYRAEGPYFLVKYLDEALFFSCEHTAEPLYAKGK